MNLSVKPYSQKTLDKAQSRAVSVSKTHGTSQKIGSSGLNTMNIPEEAYHNAIQRNGGVIDGKTVWSDREFRRDMCKRHPELVVKAADGGSKVGGYTGEAAENFTQIFGKR